MSGIERRRFLQVLGAGAMSVPLIALLDACGDDKAKTSSSSLGAVSLQLTWLKDQTFLGDYQADAKGYWTSRGLAVTLLAGGGDIDPLVPVVAGKAFVSAPSAASVAGAIKQGATLTIFATDTQKQPSAIISLAAKPLKTPADMVGKKIGVNSATLVSFNAFLAANKIDTGKVQVVPYNYDTSILTGGSVDALYGYSYDEPVTLGLQGQQTETFLFSDFNYNVLNNAWTVPSSVLKDTQQRAQVVALMAGLVKGWTDVINDPTGLVPGLLDKYCKELSIDPKLGIAAAKATGALIQGGGSLKNIYGLTPELIKGTIAGLAQQGSTLTEANFDTTVMDDVRASL